MLEGKNGEQYTENSHVDHETKQTITRSKLYEEADPPEDDMLLVLGASENLGLKHPSSLCEVFPRRRYIDPFVAGGYHAVSA